MRLVVIGYVVLSLLYFLSEIQKLFVYNRQSVKQLLLSKDAADDGHELVFICIFFYFEYIEVNSLNFLGFWRKPTSATLGFGVF